MVVRGGGHGARGLRPQGCRSSCCRVPRVAPQVPQYEPGRPGGGGEPPARGTLRGELPPPWGHAHRWASGPHRGRDSPGRKCPPAIRAWGSLRARHRGQCLWNGAAAGRPELEGLWQEDGPCPRWALRSGREPGSGPGQHLRPVQATARPSPACPPGPLAPAPRGPACLAVTRRWKSSDLVLSPATPLAPRRPTRWSAFLFFPLNKTGGNRCGGRTSGPATRPCHPGQGHSGPPQLRACTGALGGSSCLSASRAGWPRGWAREQEWGTLPLLEEQ